MEATRELALALVGAGRIGQVHADHLTNWIKGARLAAVSDVNGRAAERIARQCGVPRVAKDYRELLDDPSIDGLVVCSSTSTHAEIITSAAQAGKHVFCEKPVDTDLGRIEEIIDAVRENGTKLQVGFNRRFDPNFQRIQHRIASGVIGKPHIVRITSRDPAPPSRAYLENSGGMFMDMTIHDFDMARFLMNDEISEVYATGEVLVDDVFVEVDDVDTAIVVLRFAHGGLGVIDNSRRAVYGYDQRVEVFGSNGMVATDNRKNDDHYVADENGYHYANPLHFFMERYTDSFVAEMQAFVDALRENTETAVTAYDGYVPVAVAHAALRSLRERRPVRLEEVSTMPISPSGNGHPGQ